MSKRVPRLLEDLQDAGRLFPREKALARGGGVPSEAGIYAWYFDKLPSRLPKKGLKKLDRHYLLYIGISPARANSGNNLRKRIRTHFKGNASGSTLRLSLGCLLGEELGLRLRPTGSTGRLTFGDGERALSDWMKAHAQVAWVATAAPWDVEGEILRRTSPPLNLVHNEQGNFHNTLSAIRQQAAAEARGE